VENRRRSPCRQIELYDLESLEIPQSHMSIDLDNPANGLECSNDKLMNLEQSHNYITCICCYNAHCSEHFEAHTVYLAAVTNCGLKHAHDRIVILYSEAVPYGIQQFIHVPGNVINMTIHDNALWFVYAKPYYATKVLNCESTYFSENLSKQIFTAVHFLRILIAANLKCNTLMHHHTIALVCMLSDMISSLKSWRKNALPILTLWISINKCQ